MLPLKFRHAAQWVVITAFIILVGACGNAVQAEDNDVSSNLRSSRRMAAEVDRLILSELAGADVSPLTSDEDFLRRITFDFSGTVPSPREVTLFGINPDPKKRSKMVERLLNEDRFSENWARYWRDVIFMRATEQRSRLGQGRFEEWMTRQLREKQNWNQIAVRLLTATGDVRENGDTALMFAHGGNATEIAAETSRIFLGIQIQCANCHNHPTDKWTRQDFHQLAAFFPRVRVRPVRGGTVRSFEIVSFDSDPRKRRGSPFNNPEQFVRRLDKNGDGKISKNEVKGTQLARFFDRILERGDTNNDKALSIAELKKLPAPPNRSGSTEYHMPDLSNPGSQGKRVDPVFFVNGESLQSGLRDLDRRSALAKAITSPKNPWFARAFVNRIWGELLGEGFYMPIDDIGPERTASFPDVLDLLAKGFATNDFDIRWLYRTIANTETYQRQIRPRDLSGKTAPFASTAPTRLRADQLYNAITKVLGVDSFGRTTRPTRGMGFRGNRSPRGAFNQLFGFDPSTPQEDITGTVPQALFLMNSPTINGLIRAKGNTRLGQILKEFDDNRDAIDELYLLVLAREPSKKETIICLEYLKDVKNRFEAFEDLMWGLLNSSEFLSKR